MGYAQWVVLTLHNSLHEGAITFRNANVSHGKFYTDGDKDHEISAEEINDASMQPGSEYVISACGRSDSPSGTEGTVDVWHGTNKVCTLYWDCPWSGDNNFEVRFNTNYLVIISEWSKSGALGPIQVGFSSIGS
ncbi:Asp-hemolysin [Hygrophoropsis aurantiaca]|uniref:Asp-hemolysin n=1 Tax=Hygrophoropsis aurantiaca TaxID=72124 RepID=A0ACB8A9P1_9AGAM|nr:Asp-hemolysin [Hygrophoropsis aurantiaca]